MKTLINTVLALLGFYLVVQAFFYIKDYVQTKANGFDFNIKFGSSFLTAIKAISGFVTPVDLDIRITNKNDINIPIKNLYIEIFYKGNLIAKSTKPQDVEITSVSDPTTNGIVDFTHNVTIALTDVSKTIITKIISGEEVQFDYKLKGKIGILPVWYNGDFKYKI